MSRRALLMGSSGFARLLALAAPGGIDLRQAARRGMIRKAHEEAESKAKAGPPS